MKYIFICLLTIVSYRVIAQNGVQQIGGRPAGLAYAYTAESDAWSIFYNPGGLGRFTGKVSTVFALENKYGIAGLTSIGAGIIGKLPLGTAGISLFRFGDDIYSEQIISASYSNAFGLASLGIRANYTQYILEDLGSKGIISLDFGGVATLTEYLRFGAYIRNINQASLSEAEDQRAPTLLNAGFSYKPHHKVTLNLETEKDLDYEASIRLGIEYQLLTKIFVRSGINTEPFVHHAGLGFTAGRLAVEYALSNVSSLGLSHQGSIVYAITEGK